MVGITTVCEIWYKNTWKKEDPLIYDKPLMTEEEFEKRIKDGEQLVILDN
jgi:uncharacterized short protein YbdD (DUF466 family)